MKICFFITGLGTGGAEFALLRLCRALRSRGSTPTVVSGLSKGDLGELFEESGIPVLALNLVNAQSLLLARTAVREHLCRTTPDLIHGWMYHGNLLALFLAASDGVRRPVVWGIRQSLIGTKDKASTKVVIRANAALSGRASALVYNSLAARTQHEAAGFCKRASTVIPNGLDVEEFRADADIRKRVRDQLGFGSDEIVIGHVARFHPSKDHVTFLKAAGVVCRNAPNVRVLLVGQNVDTKNARLTNLVDQLGLVDRVKLIGLYQKISRLLPAFDVLCSSSSGMEAFPNVLAEAMSCEVPCVATDVGESMHVVSSTGFIVPPSDVEALATALTRLAQMSHSVRSELGARARDRVCSLFSIDSVAENYISFFDSIRVSAN